MAGVAAEPIADDADVSKYRSYFSISESQRGASAPLIHSALIYSGAYPFGARCRASHLRMKEAGALAERKAPPERGEFDP